MAKIERSNFFEPFSNRFFLELSGTNKTYEQAFDDASEWFAQKLGHAPYANYNSFKSARSKRQKMAKTRQK
jgi:hypothetical protein